MVTQITDMNNGKYLDLNIENGEKMDFCIGVAAYPEKHFEAPNMASDLAFAKAKVDAGANYMVTQMFFDNQKYFNFVDECRKIGINIPIVPGLKPITKRYQTNALPRLFYIDMPDDLVKALEKAKDKEAIREVGIEWCTAQSKELKERGAPCLHYYTMGDSDTIRRVVEGVF